MIAIGRAAKEQGIRNLCHTNGFINKRPLMELIQTLDAVNVDLKGFSDDYYRTMCQGWLKPITECLLFLKAKGVHLEISNLVIPTKNDNTDTTRRMCKWIKENLGAETPLHFIRFYPHYKLTHLPPTPVSILEAMRNTALSEGLKFSYIVNLPGHPGAHTYCPRCSRLLIRRSGFVVEELHIKENGRCKFCNESISGVWS
jgi:pyruvate formate lyase activating enzyme